MAANPDLRIAIVTYSKRLQLETARRLECYSNVDVFTFHGMAGRLFSTLVNNDIVLRNLRREGAILSWSDEPYDIVVLDEVQDCTGDLFWLTCAFLSSVTNAADGRAPRVVTLGDERQAIYAFRGADSRYLSLSPELLSPLSPYPWTQVALSSSFRLSRQTCTFINQAFLEGEEYIIGSHDGPEPLYIHAEPFDAHSLAKLLMPLIQEYGPERTAILSPFVRQNRPLAKLTNHLSENYGVRIAVSVQDEGDLDDRVLLGKMVVSTYHQFKGNERDLVIVYGADNGYFDFLGRDLPDDRCPNETFVALTRAREQLVIVHDATQDFMPFVSRRAIDDTADLVQLSSESIKTLPAAERPAKTGLMLPRNIFVSDMARHVLSETLDALCKRYLEITELAAPLPEGLHIRAPDNVLTDAANMHYEAVSDINGMAVVAAYEYELLGTLSTLGHKKRDGLVDVPTEVEAQAAWLCREATQYSARLSGYHSRSTQMARHRFDWLGPQLHAAKQRLREQLQDSRTLDFEYMLEERGFCVRDEEAEEGEQKTKIIGRADIVQYKEIQATAGSPAPPTRLHDAAWSTSEDVHSGPAEEVALWEIKFVSKLSLEHLVQASAYAYLWAARHGWEQGLPRILLFNVRDGEKWEITPRDGVDGLRCLLEEVLRAKYSNRGDIPTDEFLQKGAETREEIEALWKSQRSVGL